MKKDFEAILDESLSHLEQEESIEACLGRYPQYAEQLEPLLRTALKVEVLKDTEPSSAKAMAAGRERFLREAGRLRAERAPAHKLAKGPARKRRLMLSMTAAILIALLLALAAVAGLVPDTLRRLYHQWRTPGPQPTLTQPATDTPWPTMTPHEVQTLMATRTLYPAESDTPTSPTCTPTFTPEPTHTPTAKATHTPKPTDTPVLTMTPVPPTDTPVPTMTPMPPTDTPHPDDDADDDCDPVMDRDREQDQDCTCPDDNCDGGNDDGGDQGDDSSDGDDHGDSGRGGQP